MKRKWLSPVAAMFLAISLCSCKDDPELLKKSQDQKDEIFRLTNEITLVDSDLRSVPEDKSSELAGAETRLKELTLEANRIDSEVAELQKQKEETEKEFTEYRKKYPTR